MTEIAVDLTLEGAKSWLLSKKNGLEYSNKFADSYGLLGFGAESSLKSYLDVIVGEPYRWLRTTPVEWRSKPAYHKIKSALNKLLSDTYYTEKLGAEYCKNAMVAMKTAMTDENIAKANAEKCPIEAVAEEFVSDEEDAVETIPEAEGRPVSEDVLSFKKRIEELERDRNEKDKLIRYLQRVNKAYFDVMDEKSQRLAAALLNANAV